MCSSARVRALWLRTYPTHRGVIGPAEVKADYQKQRGRQDHRVGRSVRASIDEALIRTNNHVRAHYEYRYRRLRILPNDVDPPLTRRGQILLNRSCRSYRRLTHSRRPVLLAVRYGRGEGLDRYRHALHPPLDPR